MADVLRLPFQSLRFSSSLITSFSASASFQSLQFRGLSNPKSTKSVYYDGGNVFSFRPNRKKLVSFKVNAAAAETGQPKWWERSGGPNMIDIHSTQEFLTALSQAGDKLVIVEFYGTWCASCRALFPKLCKTAEEHPEIVFLKVNFDENKPMCKGLNVKVLPFFHFYRGADGQLDAFSCSLAKCFELPAGFESYGDFGSFPDLASFPGFGISVSFGSSEDYRKIFRQLLLLHLF